MWLWLSWWLFIDWRVLFFFFFFYSSACSLSWMMAAAALLIDLTVFQGFSTNPPCALHRSPGHLSWWPKLWKLIYRSNIVFSRRQRLTWLDQWGSEAGWITMCPMDRRSWSQRMRTVTSPRWLLLKCHSLSSSYNSRCVRWSSTTF